MLTSTVGICHQHQLCRPIIRQKLFEFGFLARIDLSISVCISTALKKRCD